jgi:hypothetical protein
VTRAGVPRDLDRGRLKELWAGVDRRRPVGERIEALTRRLLGRPYVEHPLLGGPREPEVFTASLERFDCVTFVESVLSLARARSPQDFASNLRHIRYAGGRVEWRRRNHYTTGWIRSNEKAGFVQAVRLPARAITRTRTLNVVPGYPVRRIRLTCVPKERFWRARAAVQTGDIVSFVSTKSNLDIYHLGFAAWEGDRLMLRNAARSKGLVVSQPLEEFLGANRMAGVIVTRPAETR